MARKTKVGVESSPPANSTDRKRIIRECCTEIATLEAQRGQIGDQIKEIKQKRIKGDLGMKLADFNAALRAYSLEGEDLRSYLDALREVLQANSAGYQADWVEVATGDKREGAAETPAPSEEVLNELRENGRAAGKLGRGPDANPHDVNTREGLVWHSGWLEGQKELAEAQFSTAPEREASAAV